MGELPGKAHSIPAEVSTERQARTSCIHTPIQSDTLLVQTETTFDGSRIFSRESLLLRSAARTTGHLILSG